MQLRHLRRNTGIKHLKINKKYRYKAFFNKQFFVQINIQQKARIRIWIRIDLALLDPDPQPHWQYEPGPDSIKYGCHNVGRKKHFLVYAVPDL